MKKNILISISVLFLLIIAVIGYLASGSRYQPLTPTGTLTSEEAGLKGLHIQDMSIEKGLTGWYKKGNYVIYFGSKRGALNPWIERIFAEAPKYEVSTIFSDNKGEPFSSRGGISNGNDVQLPKNKNDGKIDQGEVNFSLALEAVELLKQTEIDPKLDYEYDAIINSLVNL